MMERYAVYECVLKFMMNIREEGEVDVEIGESIMKTNMETNMEINMETNMETNMEANMETNMETNMGTNMETNIMEISMVKNGRLGIGNVNVVASTILLLALYAENVRLINQGENLWKKEETRMKI